MIALAVTAALLGAAPPPLACPAGTEHRGARPLEAYEEYCVELQLDGKERREGPSVTYYDDGSVWAERGYHQGELDGPYRERHRNGRIAREGAYAAGRKVGTWRTQAEDGTLLEESSYRDGHLDGTFTDFWPGGRPRTRGRYCHGVQCGVWQSFDEQGSPRGSIEYDEPRAEP